MWWTGIRPLFLSVCRAVLSLLLLAGMAGATAPQKSKSGSSAATSKPEDDPNDPWRFANVKEWRLSVFMDAHDEMEKKSADDYEHYSVIVGGKLEAKLTRGNVSSRFVGFGTEDTTEWPSNLMLVSKAYVKHTGRNGSKSWWTDSNITGGGRVVTGALSLVIEPDQGTFKYQRSAWMLKHATVNGTSSEAPPVHQDMPYPLPFNWLNVMPKDMPLPKSGLVLEGNETFDWPSAPFVKGSGSPGRDLTVTITWRLEPWKDDAGDPKLEGPKDWLPEDGAQPYVAATWKGTAAEVKFTLYDVSNEKGTCLNSADKSEAPDLSMMEGAGFEIKKISEGTWTATGKAAGDNFSQVPIECHDSGAWGKVKCEVKINGTWQTAKASSGKDYVAIPKDDNDNHIADKWEQDEDAEGLEATWDQAEVAGQETKGDGLALYEKYRGALVLEGGQKRLKRLPAHDKVHFVIDPNGLFDLDRWYQTSGIHAYKLTSDLVDGDRRVDFNAGTAEAGGKYASRIEQIDGFDGDPESMQYAASQGPENVKWTPRTCDWSHLYPDRIGAMVDRVIAKMKSALKHPTAPDSLEEAQILAQLAQTPGMSMAKIEALVENFNAAARQERVNSMIALTAIHEVGHASGLLGHLVAGSNIKEDEDNVRNPSCPMQYLDRTLRRRFVLFGELGGDGTFCKVAPDNCWKDLNVKN